MISPINEELMFQAMHDRTADLLRARNAAAGKPAARRWWRTTAAKQATRRTR
jgi:hypothetical protein